MKCYVFVLFNIKKGKSKVWDGFRNREMIVYSMKPDYHEEGMNERAFPEVANGIIILLNLKKLSDRNDELGEISRDLLASGEEEVKNEHVRKRMKEVFTNEEVKKMCLEEERFLKSEAKKLVKEQEKKIEEKIEKKVEKKIEKKIEEKIEKKIEEKETEHVRFMFFSLGATPEKISEGIKMPLEKVKAILAI